MKLEAFLWSGVTAYFVLIALIYGAVGGSAGGVTILIVAAAFGGLVAGWSWHWSRHHDPRPEDRDHADVHDSDPEIGVFAAGSLRPLGIGAGICIAVAGFPLGSWMVIAGAALLASQVGLLVRDRDA